MNARIDNELSFHKATEVTAPLHTEIRKLYREFAHRIDAIVPDGREKSLWFTALQESQMWAHAGVAINLAPMVEE